MFTNVISPLVSISTNIFNAPTSKDQISEISYNVVGHEETTQVAVVVMHKD